MTSRKQQSWSVRSINEHHERDIAEDVYEGWPCYFSLKIFHYGHFTSTPDVTPQPKAESLTLCSQVRLRKEDKGIGRKEKNKLCSRVFFFRNEMEGKKKVVFPSSS
jgi:hypothetical protein